MLEVTCTGTPHEIGLQHGIAAGLYVSRSIKFYQGLFQTRCQMSWPEVRAFASKTIPYLSQDWPQYITEIQGIATGSGVEFEDILALNVRTEIAYGAFNDGCTALSWRSNNSSILAQNWDWNVDQAENLVHLKIKREDGMSIEMITEAGIIGKIGLNSNGVGCSLNALRAKGVDFEKLPCHLALRTVLESGSRDEAIGKLEKAGVASACHILIADESGGMGLECSSEDVVRVVMDREGLVTHTNHFVGKHKNSVVESIWLPDTGFRLRRIDELLRAAKEEEPSSQVVERILRDEVEGNGAAICRSIGKDGIATLFSIVMDMRNRSARVLVGKPSDPKERLILNL